MSQQCNSCKQQITNDVGTVTFICPQCSKNPIIRCVHCRKAATKYQCHECGFRGPN